MEMGREEEDGKERMMMGRTGWRWEGRDEDGKGRMEDWKMGWEGKGTMKMGREG